MSAACYFAPNLKHPDTFVIKRINSIRYLDVRLEDTFGIAFLRLDPGMKSLAILAHRSRMLLSRIGMEPRLS